MLFSSKLYKLVLVGFLLVLFASFTSGCQIIDRLQAWKNGELPKETEQTGQNTNPSSAQGQQGTSTQTGDAVPPQGTNSTSTGTAETRQIVLYFTDAERSKLVTEQREIVREEGLAKATINELIKGPGEGSNLKATLPEGTLLNSINIKEDGLCLADFNAKLIYNHPNDEKAEQITVYSIVNTLCQFSSVKEVQILVEGKKVETLAGFMDISKPLTRKE